MDETTSRFVPVAKVGDLAQARILAALLEAEGIEVRLHSESLGPYPVTVGALATTELWVPSDRVADASHVLLDAEVQDAVGGVIADGGSRGPIIELRLVAGVLLVLVVLAVVLRLMQVY